MNPNPLSQYFRQPAIYVRLPSQGEFYPPGALAMPPNGELPVLPMTTIDEITYRTPDALFNGQAVVSVIQSCIPNIRDAWAMPAMDIDTALIAIRIATYGHQMDIDSMCPKCNHENNFGLDLRGVLDQIGRPDYSTSFKAGDLEIFFRPMNYRNINDNNLAQFEEQKILQSIDNENITDEDRAKKLGDVIKDLTQITVAAIANSINVVKTPQATVNDPAHISEWLTNCDRKLFNQIRDHVIKTKTSSEIPPLKIKCQNCENNYEQAFTLNMSDFFGDAS